jgi:hypothetical protein
MMAALNTLIDDDDATAAQLKLIRDLAWKLGLRNGPDGEEMAGIIGTLTDGRASALWELDKRAASRLIDSLFARIRHAPAWMLSLNRDQRHSPLTECEPDPKVETVCRELELPTAKPTSD